MADWAAFLAAVAAHYPQAAGIEIWNEPNHPAYWGRGYSSNYPDPDYYAQMLHSVYDAVKSVDPSIPVIGGALANWQVTGGGKISALDFATALFADGAAGYMDAISIHPYPQTLSPLTHTIFELGINQMRTARATVGATTPIWVTELGVSTTGPTPVTEYAQASILTDTFRWIQTQPDIEAFFIHTLTEPNQVTSSAGRIDTRYTLSYATGSAPAGGSATLNLRLSSYQVNALRTKLNAGETASALVKVTGYSAGKSSTGQVTVGVK